MTGPPPPPSAHLDLDALADVLAGERPEDPHLAACASCRERLAVLEAAQGRVAAALAALPDPALPDGLDDRLAQDLRAAAGARGTVTPLPHRPRRAWVPAAAASLVLVLGGGLGWALLSGSGTGADEATTSAAGGTAGSDGSAESAESSESSDGAGSSGAAGTTAAALPPRTATGTDYADASQRVAALPRLLDSAAGPVLESAPGPAALAAPGDALARLSDPQALAGCLSAVTSGGSEPLAVDEGRFAGAPALAVVLPSSDPEEVVLHVVGPACAETDADTLLVTPVPRP